MFKNCRKEDLRIVALELDRKKAEEARLREKEPELELARLHRVNSDNERTDEGYNSLDALVKSVRILTVKVPNRPEVSIKIFSTLEKEVASHISVRAGNDWFRPLELAKEIDLYNTSRGKCLKPLPNVFTRNNPVKSASRVFSKAKDCKSRYVCSNCQKRHHNTIHYTKRARDQEVINSTLEPLNTSAPEFIPSAETQNNLLTAEYAFLESDETKALGIIWNSRPDCFLFRIEQQRPTTSFTKRMVLSTIARIFDPLGLLGPIIAWAKIFIQRLWLLELGWSNELPFKEEKEWRRFIDSLEAVNNISIDRCIVVHRAESIELHAFSDVSEKVYGASIYLPWRR
ncbi:integrase_H2C2 domain-containing protein [Trichonephila clavata]|uniref:Integrase_H2C2 domain-containing protein n=1 Tax=Trichonephila clavata TaxID=2740835 RepID=A0A8X6G8F2_TRICU|nr:integrase_H2C2 domain-containing protein [Trichonephila clavata]